MKNEAEAGRAVAKYADTVRRVCFTYLKNDADVEDVFQEVFLKYILHVGAFESEAHEKAWLIRVSINACKDVLKSFFRRHVRPLEEATESVYLPEADRTVLDAVRALPPRYREVIYLCCYEGYTAGEAGRLLGRSENTVYSRLSRARAKLKELLGGDFLGE